MSFRGVSRLLVTSHHYPLKIELGEECLVTHHARNANKMASQLIHVMPCSPIQQMLIMYRL